MVPGARVICALCDEALRAFERAVAQIRIQPELLARALKRRAV